MRTETGGIVGREAQVEEIHRFLAEPDGVRAALLEGPAGIGKTTLWRAGCAEAASRGYRVLAASPTTSETELSFAVLADLLEPVLEDVLVDLPEPQRRALEAALLLTDAEGPPPETRAVAFAVARALRTLAARGPVVVAIDDVQWLDAPSATVLEYAARRLADAPVSFLVARRGDPGGAVPLGLDRALANAAVARVPVGPLTMGAIHHLVRERLGTALPRRLLRRTHEVSGGNPLYALEIARAAFSADRQEELVLPDTLRALVRDRVSRLPLATRECLAAAAAAALAEPTLERVLATTDETEDALAPAVDDDVIEVNSLVRFTHPLLAAAAETSIPATRRRALRARLAENVSDREERARHLAAAATGPDPRAAAALEDAAEQARSRGSPAAAAELLEDAARLTAPDDIEPWARRTLAAAEAHVLAGEGKRPHQLRVAVVERFGEGHPLRVEALTKLGLDATGDLDASVRLLEQALQEAGEAGLRARALLALSNTRYVRNEFAPALGLAREAADLARASNDRDLLARALAEVGLMELTMVEGDPVGRIEEARRLVAGAPDELAYRSPTTWLAYHHLWSDHLDEARALLEAQYEHAVRTGDDASRGGFCLHLAEVEWRAGRWRAGRRYADEQTELAEQHGGTHERGISFYARALVEASEGNLELARSLALEGLALADEARDRLFPIQHRIVLGFVELTAGDYAACHAHLGPLPQLLEDIGFRNLGCFPFYPDEIEALIGLGDLEEAARLTAELERRATQLDHARFHATAARCRGLVAAAHGDVDAALAHLERALAAHDDLAVPFERGRTLLVLGVTQRRARQKRPARESLESALATFDELGARAWAEKARAELARVSGRGRAATTLTATEQRVADLVAQGRTNKDVARELFVSVKSVEKNLSNIYGKLGVRSRTELAHRLSGAPKE